MRLKKQISHYYLLFCVVLCPTYAASSEANPVTEQDHLYSVKLRKAVEADDANWISTQISYPLDYLYEGHHKESKNRADFILAYHQIINAFVKKTIAMKALDDDRDLFKDDTGLMIGNGAIWFQQHHGTYRIIAVNNTPPVTSLPPQPICKTDPRVVEDCYTIHGTLTIMANGRPRLQPSGTKRLLGIADKLESGDDTSSFWPDEIDKKFSKNPNATINGTFSVCPFTHENPREMTFVCIDSAANLDEK